MWEFVIISLKGNIILNTKKSFLIIIIILISICGFVTPAKAKSNKEAPILKTKQEIVTYIEKQLINRSPAIMFKTTVKTNSPSNYIKHVFRRNIFSDDRRNNMHDIYCFELFTSYRIRYKKIATNQKSHHIKEIIIEPIYSYTKNKERWCMEKIKKAAKKLNLRKSKVSKYKKIKKINKYIIQKLQYKTCNWDIFNALKTKKANCTAYSTITYMLCKEAGIECRIICNKTHAWNIVKVNNKWYHLDVTWNDTTKCNSMFFLNGSRNITKIGHKNLLWKYKTNEFKNYYKFSKKNYRRERSRA